MRIIFNDVNSNLTILTESEKLETQSIHINRNRKGRNLDIRDLVKLRKGNENNPKIPKPKNFAEKGDNPEKGD